MRSRQSYNYNQEYESHDYPERTLWLAVIERALKDYCFFFDRVLRNNSTSKMDISCDALANPKSAIYKKRIGEFQRLRWFLYNTDAQPFNLEYLVDILYEPHQDMLGKIRLQAAKVFKRHLDETRAANRFPLLVKYVDENTGANKAVPDLYECPLRWKRYRIKTDV